MVYKKNLVILIPGFPKDETDSTCLPFHQAFICNLTKQYINWDITVLALQYPFQASSYFFNAVPVISFAGKNKGGISKLLLRRKVYKTLETIHKEKKIDALLSCWCGETALIGNSFARKHTISHRCWLMGQDAKKANNYVKKIKPATTELIALSDFLQNEFEKNHGIRPAKVVPPGIKMNLFSNQTVEKDIDLLAVGSLIPLKQFEIFIEVAAAIKNSIPSLKAVLIGDGPEKEKLAGLIHKLNLSQLITVTGELPHTETMHYMHRSKVFLHPSGYEGFGLVNLEALYAGATVISFVQPMKAPIQNWQIVPDKETMITEAVKILHSPEKGESSIPYKIEDTVKNIMELFTA
jgi:glycosyltransferase involved in cell wall biosynthesis